MILLKVTLTSALLFILLNEFFEYLKRQSVVKEGKQTKFFERLFVFVAISRVVVFCATLILGFIYTWIGI